MKPVKKILQSAAKKIDYLDSEYLLAYVLGQTREWLITHRNFKVPKIKEWKFNHLVRKRSSGFPAHYLTKNCEFYGLDFFVNKNVLVPRPSTETIVEKVLEIINENFSLIDVGTGSGNIPIAINKTLQLHNFTTPTTFATDISKRALDVAKKNAQRHNVNIEFLLGDLLQPFLNNTTIQQYNNTTIIITANLPYLTQEDMDRAKTIRREPKVALLGYNEGLSLYKQLLQQIEKLLQLHNFTTLTTLFEMNPAQIPIMEKIILEYFPNATISVHKDLGGMDRIVKMTI